ncbi:MAG: sigma-E processing peptidase SpoIIGA [Christensenellales bacterium]
MKVYLELVILDNIWADALVLFGTAKWLQTPYAKGRVWAGAAVGTAYAVLSLARGFVFLQHPLIKIAMSFGMVFIAFGFGGKAQYARHCAVFWLFSVLLAAGVRSMARCLAKPAFPAGFWRYPARRFGRFAV